MGASIHMHLETKLNGQWHHFSAPHIFRNGLVFDYIAGIYHEDRAIVTPRGLPANLPGDEISFVTRFCYEQDQQSNHLHHTGYLNADELRELNDRMMGYFNHHKGTDDPHVKGKTLMDFDLEDAVLHTYINDNAVYDHQGWDDVRLIFWFDG